MHTFNSFATERKLKFDLLNVISRLNLGSRQRILLLKFQFSFAKFRKYANKRFSTPKFGYDAILCRFLHKSRGYIDFLDSNSDSKSCFGMNMYFNQLYGCRSYTSGKRVFKHGNLILYFLLEKESVKEVYDHLIYFYRLGCLQGFTTHVRVQHLSKGIDFLGWTFRIRNRGEMSIYPNMYNWINYKTNIKRIIKTGNLSLVEKLYRVRCLSMYWKEYNRFCDLSAFRDKFYHLKKWFHLYLKKTAKLSKGQRIKILNYIF